MMNSDLYQVGMHPVPRRSEESGTEYEGNTSPAVCTKSFLHIRISRTRITLLAQTFGLPKYPQGFFRVQRLVPSIKTWSLRTLLLPPYIEYRVICFQAGDICAQHHSENCLADTAELKSERKSGLAPREVE